MAILIAVCAAMAAVSLLGFCLYGADEGAARRTAALYVRDFTSEELKDMFGGRR